MIESVGIAMVKNEADVIEAFVRHNLAYLDAVVVIDNGSVDGTRQILVELRREGLPIIVFDDPIVAYMQAEIITAAYRKVVPVLKPRFVFLLDADEFIVTSSREVLYSQLRSLSPGSQATYAWRTYVPAPVNQTAGFDPLRSITHRRVSEQPWSKSIIVTHNAIDSRLKIQQGGHDVTVAGVSLRKSALKDAVLAHFPVRSVDQITGKALVGWIAYLERNRQKKAKDAGFQWKSLYERIVYGDGLTEADVTTEALNYAQQSDQVAIWDRDVVEDPVVPAYAGLSISPDVTSSNLQKVVSCVDGILNPESISNIDKRAVDFLRSASGAQPPRKRLLGKLSVGRNPKTAFSDEWHHQNLFVDLPPFRYIAEQSRPDSVLDIGCGAGAYLKYFVARGASHVFGVDGIDPRSSFLSTEDYAQVDLSEPLKLDRTFDTVICVEVIEHLPAEHEQVLLDSITRHAGDRIVFSGARPGQPGVGHINCRPVTYWLDEFASRGWFPNLVDSVAMRTLSTFSWFRSNLVVLSKDGGLGGGDAYGHLAGLAEQSVKWDAQKPAVITHPFADLGNLIEAEASSPTEDRNILV
jgi:SAM-dependent methyltransferase